MTSKTSICNKAFIKLGIETSINIDTDTSKPATRIKAVYDDILLEVLREYNWNFATYRQALNADGSFTPAYGFSYAYILPTVPQMVKLIETEEDIEYKLENNYLLTNETSVNIRFIGKETNPNKYDSIFVDLFATRMAVEIGHALTGDKSLVASLEQRYLLQLSKAKDKDFQEDNQKPIRSSSFNNSRLVSTDLQLNSFESI